MREEFRLMHLVTAYDNNQQALVLKIFNSGFFTVAVLFDYMIDQKRYSMADFVKIAEMLKI